MSGSLHFYGSPRPEGSRSLHFYESGALTGQNRPQGGLRIPAFLRVPAPRGAQIPAFLRVRRPDRPGPSRGGCPDPCIFTCPRARGGPRNLHFYGSGRGEAPNAGQRSDPGGRSAPPRLRRPGTRKNAGKKASQGDEKNGSSAPAPSRVNILNHTILYDPSLILYIPTNPHASSPSPGAADSNGLRPLPPPPGNTISMQSVKEALRIIEDP